MNMAGLRVIDDELGDIGVVDGLRVLIISDNYLFSFERLKPQPDLITVIARDCPLQFLNGLTEQHHLSELDVTGTPVAHVDGFRARAIATLGTGLVTLNGADVTDEEREAAMDIDTDSLLLGARDITREAVYPETVETVEVNRKMRELYLTEQRNYFRPFMLNKAMLIDAIEFGPLPVADMATTDEDLGRITREIHERNGKLRELISAAENRSIDGSTHA